MSEWKEIPLSKTTKFIVDNRGKTAPTELAGIPLIATNCISNNNLYPIYENLRYVSPYTYESWFRSHPEPGDIILTLKGSQNGAVCLVPNPVKFVIAQDMVALRVDEDVIDRLFLFAALRSPDVQTQIKNLDVSGVIPHLKKSDFDKLILPYPDRKMQESIGQIYFSLSNKIDLLHRQNATLEKMAETLFRQWFVEPIKKITNEGAEVADFSNANFGKWIKETVGGEWGKENPEGDFNKVVYCIRGTDIADLNIGLPTKTPIRFVKETKFKNIEPLEGDLIIEISGGTESQSTGRVCYVNQDIKNLFKFPLVFSNFCRMIRVKKAEYSFFLYCYIQYLYNQDEFFNLENGSSGIKNLDYKALLFELEYPMPNENLVIDFHNQVVPFFKKVNQNKIQIRTLSTLRDTLLPKLMSGELTVELKHE